MKYINLDYFGRQSSTKYFTAVEQLTYSLLLDSSSAENGNNRFDIILAMPEQVLISQNNLHHVKNQLTNRSIEIINCFDQINHWLEQYQNNADDSALPFTGGVAGVFGYDVGRCLEKLPNIATANSAIPDLVLGLYFCPLIIDHQSQSARLYQFNDNDSLFQQLAEYFKPYPLQSGKEPKTIEGFSLTSRWQSNMTTQEYAKKFTQVKQYIKSGDCYQINLAQRFEANYSGSEWCAYQELSQINRAPFSAFFRMDDCSLISLSPERFIQKHGEKVITQPIKGTRSRGRGEAEDKALAEALINSEKDRAENLMIVDLLRNDLGRTARAGSVKVTELFGLYSFPSVHHLISTIEAIPQKEYSNADVIKLSFPGGSITGAPKIRAMEIIEELEPHRRHFYCGSVSYFSFNGNMDSSILIRSLITHQQKIYTWAGGGLVDDSDCEEEYAETFTKLSKILAPLAAVGGQQKIEP